MDISKLTRTDRLIAGGGLALFVASFLPWFTGHVSGTGDFASVSGSSSGNGWDVGFIWGGLPALLGLVAAILVLGTKLGTMRMPDLPVGVGQAFLGAAALATVLVVLKLLIGESADGTSIDGLHFEIKRAWGLFLAVLASLTFLAGGYLRFNEEKAGGGRSSI